MTHNRNILVNGCSFSRGPGSWPYHLKNANITNLAQAGAGNTYIHETTIAELAQRSYDLVVIMWTGLPRVDFKVNNIDYFSDSKYTSRYQSLQNDWPEKVIEPVNDQDYVEKNWVFGCGHVNNEKAMIKTHMFDWMYHHLDQPEFVYNFLIKAISLQSFLKQMNIPYVFTFFRDYVGQLKQHPALYQLLDQRHIYNEQNIYQITESNNWYDTDGFHPGVQAHQAWATLIDNFIDNYDTN